MGSKVIGARRDERLWRRPQAWVLSGILSGVLAGPLGGCTTLPSSGPTSGEIASQHSVAGPGGFQIVDIDAMDRPADALRQVGPSPSSLTAPGEIDRVGAGDVLQITVFEVGASLFATPSASLSNPARSSSGEAPLPGAIGENFPPVTVEQDGSISFPYAGRLEVAGLRLHEIQDLIAERLKRNSQAPQVIVSLREAVSSTVVLMGEVKKPGRIGLSLAQDRLLDAVAAGGGFNYPAQDLAVRVTRNGRSAAIRLTALSANAADNIALLPQDRIELVYRPRTFTVFGAAGKVSEQSFQTPRVNLAEAIAEAGGPLDQQADPRAIYVFRYSAGDTDGVPIEGAVPVAYRLDLMQAQSYFRAQTFDIHPRDVIYIANASSIQPTKLLQVLNLFFSPIYTAKVVSQ